MKLRARNPASVFPILTSLIISLVVTLPIAFLVLGMFWKTTSGVPSLEGVFTLEFVTEAVSGPIALPLLYNSLLFATGGTLIAVPVGAGIAWIVSRTDTPGRGWFDLIPLVPFVFPAFARDIAWILLASPRIGIVNSWLKSAFGLAESPLNIYSMVGMIWVIGLGFVPLTYLLTTATFAAINPELEEAARISGSGHSTVLRRVTLPLMLPALGSAAMYVFIKCVEAFETPVFIGLPAKIYTYVSLIYENYDAYVPPRYGLAAAQSSIFLILSALLISVYLYLTRRTVAFTVLGSRGYRRGIMRLGRWRYVTFTVVIVYLLVAVALPIAMLFLVSIVPFYSVAEGVDTFARLTLQHYSTVFEYPEILRSFVNTVLVGVLVGVVTGLLAALMSYTALKTKTRGRRLVEAVGMFPIVFPGIVLSTAILWTFLLIAAPLYGSIWVFLMAFVIAFLPFSMRAVSSALIQIHDDLEEQSRSSGASWLETFRRITLPLLRPALLSAFIYIFVDTFKNLGIATILATPDFNLMSPVILAFWNQGQLGTVSASVIVIGAILTAILVVVRTVLKVKVRA